MNGNKLIQVLSTLNKEEWISYRKYLLMYTSEDSDNYRVFAYLQRRKSKVGDLPELEEIRSKHFHNLSSKSILNILSRLYLWLEEWLVFYTLKNDKMESDLILVKQLNRRGLYNLADQKTKRLQKQITNENGLSIRKSRIQSDLYYYQYYSDNPIKNNPKENIFSKLFESTKTYNGEKIRLLETELYNKEKLDGADYTHLIDYKHKSELENYISILKDTVKNLDLEAFQQIKKLLLSETFERGSDIHIIITFYLQNLISRFYNITIDVTPKDINELYNYAIESGVLLNNGKLTVIRFNNLINSIAQSNTIEETRLFIHKWIPLVDTPNMAALKDLSESKNQYFHQNYSGISNAILLHNFTNLEERLISIGLVLISLYEDKDVDYDITLHYCNNMKRTIRRNKEKLNPITLKSSLNFIKILELLYKSRKRKLDVDIKNYHPVLFKSWVSQKIK